MKQLMIYLSVFFPAVSMKYQSVVCFRYLLHLKNLDA